MTAKERDRLKVLHEVRQRHITQKQAAAKLGIERVLGTQTAGTVASTRR